MSNLKNFKEFDESFLYSYFDEVGKKIGVFTKGTARDIIEKFKDIFDRIELE